MPTALVVEDDPDLRTLITTLLDRAGYAVWSEADGRAGLQTALRVHPDVAVLDWLLPERSGVEVCRALRSEPALADCAVVMVSARAQDHDLEWGYSCGVDDYLVKPFHGAELLARVKQAVERRQTPTVEASR